VGEIKTSSIRRWAGSKRRGTPGSRCARHVGELGAVGLEVDEDERNEVSGTAVGSCGACRASRPGSLADGRGMMYIARRRVTRVRVTRARREGGSQGAKGSVASSACVRGAL